MITTIDRHLTPPEAARMLRVSPRRIRAEISAGRLRAANLATDGRPQYRIAPSDLAAYLAARSTAPTPPAAAAVRPTTTPRPRPKKWNL